MKKDKVIKLLEEYNYYKRSKFEYVSPYHTYLFCMLTNNFYICSELREEEDVLLVERITSLEELENTINMFYD